MIVVLLVNIIKFNLKLITKAIRRTEAKITIFMPEVIESLAT